MTKIYVLLAVLALAAVVPTQAAAELPFTIYGGAGFGKWMEDGAPDGGIGIGAGIIYPFENSPFAIGGELGYQMLGSYDYSYSGAVADASAEVKFSAIPVTAQGYYMIPVQGSVAPYVDLGLGFYSMRWKYDFEAGVEGLGSIGLDDTQSETDLGINLGGGLMFGEPDAKLRFGADLKYHIVMTENESTSIITAFGRVYF